jgi:hypothetical protein
MVDYNLDPQGLEMPSQPDGESPAVHHEKGLVAKKVPLADNAPRIHHTPYNALTESLHVH